MEESSNARMDDSHVELIVRHYAPESLAQIAEAVDEPELVEEIPQPSAVEPAVTVAESDVEETPAEEPQVIRVQKIELSGLKVLGKIELPEPKKKEVVPPAEEGDAITSGESSEPVGKPRTRKKGHQRPMREQRSWKNPVEMQREREARAAEEKKRKAQQLEKEKRKRHYEEKVKSVSQPRRAKPLRQQPEVRVKPVDTRPVPKTWFGKFLRWWTT
jgi:hypothetical protein